MKIRVVYKPDQSVPIIYPAPKSIRKNETKEEWFERVFIKIMQGELKDLPYDDIDSFELPQTREDRDAWTGQKGEGVSIDQEKAIKLKINKETKAKINNKIRDMAIESLKMNGELPEDYEEIENE